MIRIENICLILIRSQSKGRKETPDAHSNNASPSLAANGRKDPSEEVLDSLHAGVLAVEVVGASYTCLKRRNRKGRGLGLCRGWQQGPAIHQGLELLQNQTSPSQTSPVRVFRRPLTVRVPLSDARWLFVCRSRISLTVRVPFTDARGLFVCHCCSFRKFGYCVQLY